MTSRQRKRTENKNKHTRNIRFRYITSLLSSVIHLIQSSWCWFIIISLCSACSFSPPSSLCKNFNITHPSMRFCIAFVFIGCWTLFNFEQFNVFTLHKYAYTQQLCRYKRTDEPIHIQHHLLRSQPSTD